MLGHYRQKRSAASDIFTRLPRRNGAQPRKQFMGLLCTVCHVFNRVNHFVWNTVCTRVCATISRVQRRRKFLAQPREFPSGLFVGRIRRFATTPSTCEVCSSSMIWFCASLWHLILLTYTGPLPFAEQISWSALFPPKPEPTKSNSFSLRPSHSTTTYQDERLMFLPRESFSPHESLQKSTETRIPNPHRIAAISGRRYESCLTNTRSRILCQS